MAASRPHLLLSIEICPDRLHVALLDTLHRLTVINSTTISLRCETTQDPRRDGIHEYVPSVMTLPVSMRLTSLAPSVPHNSSAAYDPSLPHKSTAGSHAAPFAVRDYLEALDDALDWLCTAASTSLSSSYANEGASLASKIVAISIASAVSSIH